MLTTAAPFGVQAQEPTFMEAATHPGTHQSYARALFYHSGSDVAGHSVKESAVQIKVAYGITARWAALADLYGRQLERDRSRETGLATATGRLKYRLFKYDTGPINTVMASIMVGVEVPGSSQLVAPDRAALRLGAATTTILGRHGFNVAVDGTFGSKRVDPVDVNVSYLYRLAPSIYAVDTKGAWYVSLESLNTFANTGNNDAFLAPGLLYEARRWAAELAVKFPWHEEGDARLDAQVALGARYLF